jgi:hypothetical protein
MAKYLIARTVDFSKMDLEAAARRSVEELKKRANVKWIKSFVSEAEGKIYCEYEAPDLDSVIAHQHAAGLPYDTIALVGSEISPDMFQ